MADLLSDLDFLRAELSPWTRSFQEWAGIASAERAVRKQAVAEAALLRPRRAHAMTEPVRVVPIDRRMTATVNTGGGSAMEIVDPRSFEDGGPEWVMRYGNPEPIRYTVASLLASYDYLLSDEINATEAIRRLRLMRQKRRALAEATGGNDVS